MARDITVRVLVRNLESHVKSIKFSNFLLQELDYSKLCVAREFFPNAMQHEWLLERHYEDIPPLPLIAEGWPGPFGSIPFDIEDTLLCLRLYRTGALSFVGMHIQSSDQTSTQSPYRAISPLVTTSSRPYRFEQSDAFGWEQFASQLKSVPQWNSIWFRSARQWFLYGGGKAFNPEFQDSIDSVVDYTAALEATLVPENSFVSRRLRERAVRLVESEIDNKDEILRLLKEIYGIRSALVHGSPLKTSQMDILRDRKKWEEFETILRKVLICAIKIVPSDDAARRSFLSKLYEPSDQDRAEKIVQDFKALKIDSVKKDLLNSLNLL